MCTKVKICKLCSIPFDREDYGKTMREQAPQRGECERWFGCVKYCGLHCSWLSQPGMTSTLTRLRRDKRKKRHVDSMKNDIAKRVVKYLTKEKNFGKLTKEIMEEMNIAVVFPSESKTYKAKFGFKLLPERRCCHCSCSHPSLKKVKLCCVCGKARHE